MAKSNRALKYFESLVSEDRVELDHQAVKKVAMALGSPDVSFTPEEAAAIMKNAFYNHPEVAAELMREFASDYSDVYLNAYEVALKGIWELGRFRPELPLLTEGSTSDFYARVACLKGEGSERVKFDTGALLNENIIAAERTEFGEPDAIEYSRKLHAIMHRTPRRKASKAWKLFLRVPIS
jgi:hypothetical protein